MSGLDSYYAKRDFKITAEPRGKVVKGVSKHRFVIQRHAATRLHYDLRLELDGVYKSWAVTKTPSLDPAVKRLAVEVEDHPIEYGTFEGTIPKGQYGGGTVQLWDRGQWWPQGDNAREELRKGHLKIVMAGERMKGKWALIRLRDDAAKAGRRVRHNWLLIKEIDEEAKRGDAGDALAKEVTSVASGRTLDEIAAKSTKVWNSNRSVDDNVKALKKAPAANAGAKKNSREEEDRPPPRRRVSMPDFVEPQLAKLMETPPTGSGWVHEVKFDGYRLQMRVEKGRARLRTRRGLDWTEKFPEVADAGDALPDCMIDGEVCALDREGRADFAMLQDALSSGKTAGLVYYAFDGLFDDGVDLRRDPLPARKAVLEELLREAPGSRLRYVEHFATDGRKMLEAVRQMHIEGIISKRVDAPYHSGRHDSWVKTKSRPGQEVVIGAWWGTAQQMRALLVGTFQQDKFVYMGRVGTGYNAAKSAELLKHLKPLKRDKPAFANPPRGPDINWVEPKLVAEIEYENITTDGLFRQGAYKGLRLDKDPRGIVLEMPGDPTKEEKRAMAHVATVAVKARPSVIAAKGAERDTVLGIRISHPEKELWPSTATSRAVTKMDLARYLEAVADRMLPHIANRPISIVRTPDGIGGETFYQRHSLKGTQVPVLGMKVPGQKQPYLAIDNAAALVALGQQAVTEIHPWGCKEGVPEIPERVIIDLDPDEGIGFERVIEGAREVKRRLEKLGFKPYVKTTGGKGLHVVIAVKGNPTWADAKAFAKAIAAGLEADMPDRYTTTVAKKARVGKIFVDYLRNDQTSTGVAPWSMRARDGAPIAVPITWSQVKKGLDPKKWTVLTAGPLLKKPDPWADMAKSAKPLGPAMKKLGTGLSERPESGD